MWGWYNSEVDRPPPQARVALTTMRAERKDLYRHVPPTGEPIPVEDLTLLVDHEIPEGEEIAWEVRRIRLNRSGGIPRMRAEHLRQWLIPATRDDLPGATNWLKVVAIVQS